MLPSGCWIWPRNSRAPGGKQGGRSRLARAAGGEAAGACAGARHHRLHRGRRRGSAPAREAPARRDRRSADGRHEHRRRPVRRRQDVPAAGGEVGARDEAGGRLSDAVHGQGERRAPAAGGAAERSSNGKIVMATVKGDVHDIGKNIVGVVLALQQLRGHRSRRHGAGGQDSRRRAAERPTSSACPA